MKKGLVYSFVNHLFLFIYLLTFVILIKEKNFTGQNLPSYYVEYLLFLIIELVLMIYNIWNFDIKSK